ncbi:putative ATPase family protein [Desulforapulum autotrophicum HRM2]|uniref:ATPase family protein n=1 Tax=Desulforapulum autotrophicum (strain ATCC 43914 / DSM 3382 / VKM B-1955 / HRM2) TaxID=177437 RepID=C0QJB4_DESAH|nr:helicase HerA-like domain-containing protein [Desulforapulum autotrophicum]ACN15927.1 putative ATPase family protein [Desulforapulum autotrophicum HRM2]
MGELKQFIIGGAKGVLVEQLCRMSNRHGLIAGATGTGKTVTLQVLAESFSRAGVPVFAADIKGDLSGLGSAGSPHPKIDERLQKIPIKGYVQRPYPVVFWDIFGKQGHPIRSTISEMGPLLLSNLLGLNDTQSGVLYGCFKIADDQGMLLLDLKDLRSMLMWMGDNTRELRSEYGNISSASIGAIQRRLLILEEQGAEHFFGEPAVELRDLMQVDFSGNGVISILDATRLMAQAPRVYSSFLLWLLSELFEQLPEIGDPELPKLVFFFDEAHLLFDQAPKILVDKIEQVVRLIRSKGVGIYFITQTPLDLPEEILGQLGLKIQHALRAFTPKDMKVIRAAAQSFPPNPGFDTETAVTALGIGEALVSVLDDKGRPMPVQQVMIRPPESLIGALSENDRQNRIQRSPLKGRYDDAVDRESAYEILKDRAKKIQTRNDEIKRETTREKTTAATGRKRQSTGEAFIKSTVRAIGSQIGRQIIRGIMGSFFGGRSR